MADLIDRQAVVNALNDLARNENLTTYPSVFNHSPYYLGALHDAYEKIKELPKAEPKWIPCSERLPEPEYKYYWICTDTGYQCQCRWTNANWFWPDLTTEWHFTGLPQYSKAVAWMPLPEPYQEGEQND